MIFSSKNKSKESLKRILEMRYKKFCIDFKYDLGEVMAAYERRLAEKKNNNKGKSSSMEAFYRGELEALDLFSQKIAEKINLKDRDEDSFLPNDEGLDDPSEDKKEKFRYQVFPFVEIHADVPKEMEHFFGALIELHGKIMPNLSKSKELIRDESYRAQISEVGALFDDVADYEPGQSLPLVFNTYYVKVKNSNDNANVADRAAINVYKVVVALLKKVRKIMDWLQHPKAKVSSNVSLIYENEKISISDFAKKVNTECSKILEIFGLEKF